MVFACSFMSDMLDEPDNNSQHGLTAVRLTLRSMELPERISLLKRLTGWSNAEVARNAGVSRTAPGDWLSGKARSMSATVAAQLAKKTGFDARWLATGDGQPPGEYLPAAINKPPSKKAIEGGDVAVWNTPDELPPDDTRVWVDRWDYTCSAGDGHIQWEVRQKSALPFTLAFFQAIGSKPENCKLLMVRGDSMEPFLFNRDMMMVDTSKTDIRDGQVYAVCFEGEALVKRVYKQGGGILVLNSYNDRNYPDKTVNPATAAQFEVIGEVVYRSGSGFAAV